MTFTSTDLTFPIDGFDTGMDIERVRVCVRERERERDLREISEREIYKHLGTIYDRSKAFIRFLKFCSNVVNFILRIKLFKSYISRCHISRKMKQLYYLTLLFKQTIVCSGILNANSTETIFPW